jgi:hypothetical protein
MLLLLFFTAVVLLVTGGGEMPDFGQHAPPRWRREGSSVTLVDGPTEAAERALLRTALGAAVGLGTGVWYGLHHRRRLRGLAIGIPLAIVAGAAAAVFLAHGSRLPMAAVGSLLLVVVALVVRRFSIRPPADE